MFPYISGNEETSYISGCNFPRLKNEKEPTLKNISYISGNETF